VKILTLLSTRVFLGLFYISNSSFVIERKGEISSNPFTPNVEVKIGEIKSLFKKSMM